MKFLTNKLGLINPLFLLLAIVGFAAFYEHYPRPGWVDAAVYTSYVIVSDSYHHVDGFGDALAGATYQSSRLGYIVPLRLLSDYWGIVEGRLIYNTALFLLYCFASIRFASSLIKSQRNRAIAYAFLLFNPIFISAIVFGGADGPAAVYSFLSVVALYFASRYRRGVFFVLSGACFGLAISTHLFSVVPYILALVSLRFGFDPVSFYRDDSSTSDQRRPRFDAKSLLLFSFGCVLAILLLNWAGHKLGLREFFLIYSFGRLQQSLQGSGVKFMPPIDFLIQNAALWVGVVFFLITAFAFGARKTLVELENRREITRRKAASLGFALPLLFVLGFDFIIGGNLIASPHYFTSFLPCFAIGVIFLASSLDYKKFEPVKYFSLAVLVIFCWFSVAFPRNNSALFSISGNDSKSLLISQQDFEREISELTKNRIFNLVYSSVYERGSEAYIDYYKGQRRHFDYMDTLAYTFPWVGDKMHRIDLHHPEAAGIALKPDIPTVILAATAEDLNQIISLTRVALGRHIVSAKQCGGYKAYKWCIAIINHE